MQRTTPLALGVPCEGHLLFSDLSHEQMLNEGEQTGLLIDIPAGLNGNVATKKERLHPWVLSYSQG